MFYDLAFFKLWVATQVAVAKPARMGPRHITRLICVYLNVFTLRRYINYATLICVKSQLLLQTVHSKNFGP